MATSQSLPLPLHYPKTRRQPLPSSDMGLDGRDALAHPSPSFHTFLPLAGAFAFRLPKAEGPLVARWRAKAVSWCTRILILLPTTWLELARSMPARTKATDTPERPAVKIDTTTVMSLIAPLSVGPQSRRFSDSAGYLVRSGDGDGRSTVAMMPVAAPERQACHPSRRLGGARMGMARLWTRENGRSPFQTWMQQVWVAKTSPTPGVAFLFPASVTTFARFVAGQVRV
ncbi:hypothetical protein B0T16DRAFT_391314 [Cercophora newfieldiana]|uniref:Uncharacterized protein n=1 Tax=Cercophora newfieldiana TaxID=92897 RepID=A0AA40CPX4_9PEZI|nr:hypothetical protein B0T16DRAFT_391314 [Cercophora newfieldiana]